MTANGVVWERDEGRCVRCGAALSASWPGYSHHHRQSRSVGPDRPDNLIMLCGSGTTGCHGYIHGHPAEARANGWIISKYVEDEDLADVPCTHHQLGQVTYDATGGYALCSL